MRFLVAALCASALTAQTPNALTTEEKQAGWRLLFDGKTLNGWDDPSSKTPPGDSWSVEDGCIKARSRARYREDLLSRETFSDFELTFEWKISPKGNSGVKYRIQDVAVIASEKSARPARFEALVDEALRNQVKDRKVMGPDGQAYVVAFEYQVIDNLGHLDALRGSKYAAGALYDMVPVTRQTARPVGEFNRGRIVLRGNHVEHWLNGEKVVDVMLDSDVIRQGLAKRWGEQSPVYRLLTAQPRKNCPVGLQNHGDEAWFRNIKIRPLR